MSRGGKKQGPISEADLLRFVAQGRIQPDDLLWRRGFENWKVANSFPGLLGPPSIPDIRPNLRTQPAASPSNGVKRPVSEANEEQKRRHGCLIAAGAAIAALVALAILSPPETPETGADALDKMELVFKGDYSRSTIERHIVSALEMYGEIDTEENRSRLGSVLVVMREKSGVPEMDILNCMISADIGKYKVDFPAAAALCTTVMQ